MEASELRIGNYVNCQESDFETIKELKVTDILFDKQFKELGYYIGLMDGYRYNEEQVKPIPLTEDWLKEFGFGMTTYHDGVIKWHNGPIEFWKQGDSLWLEQIWYQDSGLPDIKHVHQIQNLHFALTGKELIRNGKAN